MKNDATNTVRGTNGSGALMSWDFEGLAAAGTTMLTQAQVQAIQNEVNELINALTRSLA